MPLSQEELKHFLEYEPDTGIFKWKVPRPHMSPGDVAGTVRENDGKRYIIITIESKKYRAHRLAWLYMTGEWPEELIDHIDGNGRNNKWVNLRQVDTVNNNRNMRQRVNNLSGVTGVHWCKKDRAWVAQIKTEKNKRGYLGQFKNFDDAVAARKKAELEHDFHKNHESVRPL